MLSIGDFANLGRVSVRMLRHYDAIGLLPPASVDAVTGYRSYRADQLSRLNRVIALKDLGFTLQQVQAILDDQVGVEELRGMLRLRQAQLGAQIEADTARLTGVGARLRMIESEGRMNTEDVVIKEIPGVRLAELSARAESYAGPDITPVIGPLYPELFRRLAASGVSPCGTPIAWYETAPDTQDESGEAVTVHAGVVVAADIAGTYDFSVIDLPKIATAATIVHRGPMDEAMRSMQILARWIEDNGYHPVGYAREVCLEFDPDDQSKWVHDLQVAIVRD